MTPREQTTQTDDPNPREQITQTDNLTPDKVHTLLPPLLPP